eukprot:11178028-Lingulodinium_polyedra.AAC.1
MYQPAVSIVSKPLQIQARRNEKQANARKAVLIFRGGRAALFGAPRVRVFESRQMCIQSCFIVHVPRQLRTFDEALGFAVPRVC